MAFQMVEEIIAIDLVVLFYFNSEFRGRISTNFSKAVKRQKMNEIIYKINPRGWMSKYLTQSIPPL